LIVTNHIKIVHSPSVSADNVSVQLLYENYY